MLDAALQFSDAQTLTVSAFGTNSIDLGISRNIGDGMPLGVTISTPTELDSAGEAVTLRVLALLSAWSVPKTFTRSASNLTVVAHGLAVGERVLVCSTAEDLPAPLISTAIYYVQSVVDVDNITVAATKGGSAVALTDAGTGTHSILGGIQIVGDSTLIDEDDLETSHGTGLLGGAAAGIPFTVPLRALPYSVGRRYLHLFYTVSTAAPFTGGTVTSYLTAWAASGPGTYPSALVI